jgi:glutathione S-transferase
MWNPADYGFEAPSGGAAQQASKSDGKLIVEHKHQPMAHMVQVCADLVGQSFDVEVSADKSISPMGRLPVMEMNDDSKTRLWETEAMLQHLARSKPELKLKGESPI